MGVARLFTLLCVANSVLCNTPGTDRPDITMLYKGDNKVCVAGGNTQGHGLAFMSQNITDDVYIDEFEYRDENGNAIDTRNNCDFNEGDACSSEWVTDKLKLKYSGTDYMTPITDERWNKFTVYRTRSVRPKHEHNYDNPFPIRTNFFVSLSIRSAQDSQILLCSTQDPESQSCYWILIDAFDNKDITAIRKCVKGVPNYYPRDDPYCSMRRNETNIKLLNESKWTHFMLSRVNKNLIRLWSWDINTGARELLTYKDDLPLSLSYMYVRSFNTTAHWKIHTYQYLATTYPTSTRIPLPLGPQLKFTSSSICISFYVIMCRKCKMEIRLETDVGIEIARSSIEVDLYSNSRRAGAKILTSSGIWTNFTGNPDMKFMTWRNVKIETTFRYLDRNFLIYFNLSTTDPSYTNPFWAIDDFRRCVSNEIRVASSNNSRELLCQSLKYPDWTFNPNKQIRSIEPPICSDDRYIGLHCNISCSVPGQFQCSNNYKICLATREENGDGACACVRGNKWTNNNDCTESCSYGINYGYNCNKDCGKCKNRKCNSITGECEDGCENGFLSPYCHDTFPRLLSPPIVTEVLYTKVAVQFHDVTINGSTDIVANIRLECKKVSDVNWYNCTDPILYHNLKNKIFIPNLMKETLYYIRAVVYMTNGDAYTEDDLPFTTIYTSCKNIDGDTLATNDIGEEELPDFISTDTTSESITVRWHTVYCKNHRPRPIYYHIVFKCVIDDWCSEINDTILDNVNSNNSEITTNKLTPFTHYVIELQPKRDPNGELANFTKTAKLFTSAAIPPAVRNLTAYSKSTTSISLRWLDPYPPHGILENYKITYYYKGYYRGTPLSHTIATSELSSCDLWNEDYKCYELLNLYSDYDYTIIIQAKNKDTDYGTKTDIQVRTAENKPSAPFNLTYNWENNKINLYWNHPYIPNGRISRFEIVLEQNGTELTNQDESRTYFHVYNVNQEMKHYSEKIPKSYRYSSSYVVTVSAVNTHYKGDNATLIIDTPPETPELDGNVTIDTEKITNTTVTLSIPGAKKNMRSLTSFLYVIVNTPSKSISKREIEKNNLKQEILQQAGSNSNSWIAIQKPLNEQVITVEIGDGKTTFSENLQENITNKPLEPDSEYIVKILVMNQYREKKSFSHYTANIKTTANSTTSGLYALPLLLLLPVVGFFMYRYFKKKIVNPNPTDPIYYIEPNVPVRHSYLEVLDNPINNATSTELLSENVYESVDHLQTSPNSTSEDQVYEAMDNLDKSPTYLNLLEKERALMNSQTYSNF